MKKIIKDKDGIVNIDLIFALIIFMAGVATAILIIPGLSHENRDWRIKQYMAATRATDALIQDGGDPGWEANLSYDRISGSNYSNITKIGLRDISNSAIYKILDEPKIISLMGNGSSYNNNTLWWDFKDINISRLIGIDEYNFYIQLHPVGVNIPIDPHISSNFINNTQYVDHTTMTEVDRYVYINSIENQTYELSLWTWQ